MFVDSLIIDIGPSLLWSLLSVDYLIKFEDIAQYLLKKHVFMVFVL